MTTAHVRADVEKRLENVASLLDVPSGLLDARTFLDLVALAAAGEDVFAYQSHIVGFWNVWMCGKRFDLTAGEQPTHTEASLGTPAAP